VQALIGPYLWVDLEQVTSTEASGLLSRHHGEMILFLAASGPAVADISQEVFEAILSLPCPVWVILSEIRVVGQDALYVHRGAGRSGKY